MLSKPRPHWLKALAGGNLLLILMALRPLDSKTAFIGVFLSAGIYGSILLVRRSPGSIVRKGLVTLGLAVVLVVALMGLAQTMAGAGVSDWSEFIAQASFGFHPGRLERMRQLGLMFLEHPVAGTGVGTFDLLLPSFYAKYGAPVGGVVYLPATNHLLHIAATGGLLSLATTVWLLLAFYLKPVVGLLRCDAGRNSPWRLGDAALAGALTYLVASNWQGETWHYVPVATVFWVLLAVAIDAAPSAGWEPRMSPWIGPAILLSAGTALLLYL